MFRPFVVFCLAVGLASTGCGGGTNTVTVTSTAAAKTTDETSKIATGDLATMRADGKLLADAAGTFGDAIAECVDLAAEERITEFANCPRKAADRFLPTVVETATNVIDFAKPLEPGGCQASLADYGLALTDLYKEIDDLASKAEQMRFEAATAAIDGMNTSMGEVAPSFGAALAGCS